MSVDGVRPKLADPLTEEPVRYSNVYCLESTTVAPRLVVGPAENHIELLLSLAQLWREQLGVLYVLLVPRLGKREPGRYQSPGPLDFEQVVAFCRRFREFFEGDGRHHVWIASASGPGLLVYDQHDWIYAYGDLPAYVQLLKSQGFVEGEIKPPSPHAHSYNESFDRSEDELMSYWQWKYFPLQDQDEY